MKKKHNLKQAQTSRQSSRSTTIKKWLLIVSPIFLVHMIIVLSSGWIALNVLNHGAFWSQQPHVSPWWVDIGSRWDAGWYLGIAQNGYDNNSAPFFPLYPLLIHVFSFNGSLSTSALAGLIFSLVFFNSALIAVYACVEKAYSEQTARRTVWLVGLFPAAFFLTAIYPTSLYLFTVALFFLGIYKKQFWMIIIGGILSSLSWSSGFILCASGAIWALTRYFKYKSDPSEVRCMLASIFSPLLGLLIYAVYLWINLGTPFAALISEGNEFKQHLAIPLLIQIKTLFWIFTGGKVPLAASYANSVMVYLFNDIGIIFAIIAFVFLVKDKGARVFIPFVAFSLLIYISLVRSDNATEATARMVMVLFPLWAALANRLIGKWQFYTVLGIFSVLMVLGNILFSGGYWMT